MRVAIENETGSSVLGLLTCGLRCYFVGAHLMAFDVVSSCSPEASVGGWGL